MKKIVSILTALILLFTTAIFTGCGELDRDKELKELQETNEDALLETFAEETCTYAMFSDYITSWAKASGVEVVYAGKHSTVLQNSSTEGSSKEPSTILQCSVNTSDIQSSIRLISTAITCLLGPEKHGNIYLALTETNMGRCIGMEEIPAKYLKADRVINMQTSGSNSILTSGSDNGTCEFTYSSSSSEPRYSNAFEINMRMAEYTDPYNFASEKNYPNPVNVVGSLLATQQSSGKLFEIASFTSKRHNGYLPYSATAIVVVDDNNVEGFKKKFEKSYENMEDRFEKVEDDFIYTLTETDMPSTVLDESTANNLISLMYTLNTGICIQDEETGLVKASSYIQNADAKNNRLSIKIDVRARGMKNLRSMSEEYNITAGLCGTRSNFKYNGKVWSSKKKSPMKAYFTEKVPLTEEGSSNISIKTYEADTIAQKVSEQDMIIYSFEKGDCLAAIYNISHFLDDNYQDENM